MIIHMNNKNPAWWIIFAMEYLRNGEKGSPAYRIAKPTVSFKTAEVESCKLLKNPKFSKVLDAEREKFQAAIDLNQKEWIAEIVSIATSRPDKIEAGSKLKALEILGRHKGFLSNHLDVTTGEKSLGESFISAIAKMRADPNLPRLTSEDVDEILAAEIVDD